MKLEVISSIFQYMAIYGAIIAAIGGMGAHWTNSKIQKNKDSLAFEKESKLHEKILVLEDGNRKLNDKVEPFEDIAKKVYPAVDASKALEKLRDDFENVRAKQKELERKTAFRTLSDSQINHLIASLSQYKGQSILISTLSQENEAASYAHKFIEVFKKSGWDVTTYTGFVAEPVYGLMLVTPDNPPKNYQNDVLNIFNKAGIKIEASCYPESECNKKGMFDQFRIVVGAKGQA